MDDNVPYHEIINQYILTRHPIMMEGFRRVMNLEDVKSMKLMIRSSVSISQAQKKN